jgi:hypothetical protein
LFKDEVLCRIKAYNVITLIDFCATTLEEYYKRRLQEFANARNFGPRLFLQKLKRKAIEAENPIMKEDIRKIEGKEQEYEVKGVNDTYIVNVKSACCSCPSGMFGRFCKHQFAVYYNFNVCGVNFPPITAQHRYEMAYLALGEDAPPPSFYEPLKQEAEVCKLAESKVVECAQVNEVDEYVGPNVSSNKKANKEQVRKEMFKIFEEVVERFDPSLSGKSIH